MHTLISSFFIASHLGYHRALERVICISPPPSSFVNNINWFLYFKMKVGKLLSHALLFVTHLDSMEFLGQNTGMAAFPFSTDFSQIGMKPRSLILQVDFLPAEPPRQLKNSGVCSLSLLQWTFPTQNPNNVSCIGGRLFTSWAIRESQLFVLTRS